jgi:hypothetical protein
MPEGEKVRAQSKRTAPPPIICVSVEYFSIGILVCSKGGESSISIDILVCSKGEKVVFQKFIKTLLNTKRRISFRGSFV